MLTPQTSRASTSVGIAAVVAALLAVGLVMVASAGARLDGPIIEPRFWRTAFGRQLAFAVLGFLAMLITACGTHRWFAWRPGRRWQPVVMLFAVTVLCLVATFVPGLGVEKKGAQRWVTLGVAGLVFQPSELAKPVLVLLMAALLAGRRARLHEFRRGLLPAVIALALCAGLVGIEDFGTAGLLAGVGGALLVVAGARMLHLALVAIPGLAAMVYLIACEPYRVARLTTFLNIWDDPRGAGYHPVQSLITIASGGFAGRGLGAGVQKYGYLPEARSDFIFSVICEETGADRRGAGHRSLRRAAAARLAGGAHATRSVCPVGGVWGDVFDRGPGGDQHRGGDGLRAHQGNFSTADFRGRVGRVLLGAGGGTAGLGRARSGGSIGIVGICWG
jgi:cell division protein FtsW